MPDFYHSAVAYFTDDEASVLATAEFLGSNDDPDSMGAYADFDIDTTVELAARPRDFTPQRPGIEFRHAGVKIALADQVETGQVHRSIDNLKQDWAVVTKANALGSLFDTLGTPLGLESIDVDGILRTSTGVHRFPLIRDGIVHNPGSIRIGKSGYTQSFTGVDRMGRYDGKKASLVLGPGHGFRRDQVGIRLLGFIGMTQFKVDPMATMYKEFQLADGDPIPKIAELWATEGRQLLCDPLGYVINPKIGPPDESAVFYTLTEQDILAVATVELHPPQDPLTRITITGSEQKTRDACGIVSPPSLIYTLKRVFEPIYETQVQNSDFSLSAVTVPSPANIERTEKQVITTRIYRCGVLLYERVDTYTMDNEQAARYQYQTVDAVMISSVTRSGQTATATVASTSGLADLDVLHIFGANEPEYNGSHPIRVTSGTTFTYTVEGAPASPATGVMSYAGVTRSAIAGVFLGDDANPGPSDTALAFHRSYQDLLLTSTVETWNIFNRPGFDSKPSMTGTVADPIYVAYLGLHVDVDWSDGSPRDGIQLGTIVRTKEYYIPRASLKHVTAGTSIEATSHIPDRYLLGDGQGADPQGFQPYERFQEVALAMTLFTPFVEDDLSIGYLKGTRVLNRKFYARPGTEWWYSGGSYSRDETELYGHYSTENTDYAKSDTKDGHVVTSATLDYNGKLLGESSRISETRDGAPPAMPRLPVDENVAGLYGTDLPADDTTVTQKVEATRGDTGTIIVTVIGTDLEARYREKGIIINMPYVENVAEAEYAGRLALAEGASILVKFVTSANFLLAQLPAIRVRVQAANLNHVVALRDIVWSWGARQPFLTTVEARQYPVKLL